MPSFSFSLANKRNKPVKIKHKYDIIEKNITGVIFITINANYQVEYNNKRYSIHPDCYSCKGKSIIFRQGCNDINRFCYIRLKNEYNECNTMYWLPFGVGCVAFGNIILDNTTKRIFFYIKKIRTDYYDPLSKEACKFYREHITEINKIINERRINGI